MREDLKNGIPFPFPFSGALRPPPGCSEGSPLPPWEANPRTKKFDVQFAVEMHFAFRYNVGMESMTELPPRAEMEDAVYQRDTSYDGIFFVAVRSTGVFCRPSCPARKPLADNMEFFSTARDAMFSGYRPCKRCRPLAVDGTPPEWVEQLIDRVENAPDQRLTDADLRRMEIEPSRARRYFLKHYGITFQAYCRGRRLGQALKQIRQGAPLDDVALGNGYESHSGFRDAFGRTFGRPPGQARDAECILTEMIETPVGPMIAGATPQGVCLLEFSDRRRLEAQFTVLRRHFHCPILPGSNVHLEQLRSELEAYFAGTLRDFTVPLIYPGTDFQRRVWDALLQIPYGETSYYEKLGEGIGAQRAARAVGTANGWNRIAILIPCHRVITKSGKLGGYGGGLWRKQWLLDLEQRHR